MTRITKNLAAVIAEKLTAKKKIEIDKIRDELKTYLYNYFEKETPVEILKQFKKTPQYFKSENCIQLCGNGFNYDSFNFTKSLPLANTRINPSDALAKGVSTLYRKINEKDKEYRNLRIEIEIALTNLRTFNNARKEFPEAAILLPKEGTTEVAINIIDIQKQLK